MGGDDGRRDPRWVVVWHGYVRESRNGAIVREEGAGCELKVFADGNWIICGGEGCVLVREDDPVRFEHLARGLLGKEWGSEE